jgi:crossover junction endodeoxyribonuclease RuvC
VSEGSPANTRRILGLDPGTRFLGWGVIECEGSRAQALGHGVLRADPKLPLPERLALIGTALRKVVRRYRPQEAAVEEAFHGRSARAALRLGEGRGAALLVVAEEGVPVTGYANNVVKRAVTGGGRASKERVQAMVVRMLGLPEAPKTLEASDALALALCHHQRRGLKGLGASGPSPRVLEAVRRARKAAR